MGLLSLLLREMLIRLFDVFLMTRVHSKAANNLTFLATAYCGMSRSSCLLDKPVRHTCALH